MTPRFIFILSVVLIILAIACWPIHRIFLQGYVWMGLLLIGLTASPLNGWLRAMPRVHQVIFLGLILCVVLGHFTLSTRRFFPFIAWEIFPFAEDVEKRDPVTCLELIGTTTQGRRPRLLAEQLAPSLVQFNLPEEPEPTARALAALYNNLHPQDPLTQVDLVRVAVSLRRVLTTPGHPYTTWTLLKNYSISSSARVD